MSEFFDVDGASDVLTSSTPSPCSATAQLLKRIQWLWNSRQNYKLSMYVVNSTGNGKTYACLQLGLYLKSCYLLCATRADSYVATDEVSYLVQLIDDAEDLRTRNALALAFVRLVEKSMRPLTSQQLYDLQFNRSKKCYYGLKKLFLSCCQIPFVNILLKTSKEMSPGSKSRFNSMCENKIADLPGKKISFEDDSDEIGNGNAATADIDNIIFAFEQTSVTVDSNTRISNHNQETTSTNPISTPPNEPPKQQPNDELLVIVFDEAQGLLGKRQDVNDENCPLRCIQRALEACGIIGMFLSTTSQLEHIESREPSQRSNRSIKKAPPPVVAVVSHDLFQEHHFFLGRPLWKKYYDNHCVRNNGYNNLVRFAKSKLLSGHESETSGLLECALFCLRFGFEASTYQFCSSFVSSFLAIMIKLQVTNGRHVAECRWLSEPLLAEVSASLTMGIGCRSADFPLSKVLAEVKSAIVYHKVIQPSIGDKGEVIVAALLGYTLDRMRAMICRQQGKYDANLPDLNMSSPVPLQEQ